MDYFDDKTGSTLDENLVKAAEKEELEKTSKKFVRGRWPEI